MTQSLFVLFHRPGPRWLPEVPFPEQPGILGHITFMHGLDQQGRLVLGGPFDDVPAGPKDGSPVGIAIVEADGMADAQVLADSDESVKSGLLTVTVRAWLPRMGSALPAE